MAESAVTAGQPASVRRNAVANMAGRGASAFVWLAVTPFVLDRMGPERFGVWSLFFALGGSFATLDLGMATSMSRFVAVGAARAERRAVLDPLRRSAVVAAATGALWCLLIVVVRQPFIAWFHVPRDLAPEVVGSLPLFGASLLAFSIAQVLQGALMGFQRLDLSNGFFLAGLLVHAVVLVVGLSAGGGLFVAALAMVVGHVVNGTLSGWAVRRAVRRLPERPEPSGVRWRDLLGFGAAVQATNVFVSGQLQGGKVLLGVLGRLLWVTQFELAFRVANALWSLTTLVQGAVIPAAAHASEAGGRDAVREVYRWACRWIFAGAGVLLAGLWLTSPSVLVLWLGPGHEASFSVARVLAVGFALATVAGPAGAVARGAGWPGLEAATLGLALASNLALAWWAIPRFGPVGAALAIGASYALQGAAMLTALHRRLGGGTAAWLRLWAPRTLPPFALALVLAWLTRGVGIGDRAAALRLGLLQGLPFLAGVALLAWADGDAGALLVRARARWLAVRGGRPRGVSPWS